MGLQGKPDGSSVRNIFEGSLTEEGTGAVKGTFEGLLKYADSEARKKSDSTSSAVQIEEYRSVYPSTQEYQKLEGKVEHDLTGE